MPRLTHPDLPGRAIDVDEAKARNRRKSGWVDAVVERPNVSDTKDVWVDYARTKGVDVDGKTKQQLIDATS